jgi:DNA-binding beta-propeller fold protein YncE
MVRYLGTALAVWMVITGARAELTVTEIDLAARAGFEVNGIGPMLVLADADRNRVVVANTLSSSVTIIDGETDAVTSVPVGRRGLQHLKAAALTLRRATGTVYLVVNHGLVVVDPDAGTAQTLLTEAQFESVAVDEATGNAFLCGRETGKLGFYDARKGELKLIPWLDHAEALVNLNQTPPPPIRRIVAMPGPDPRRPGRIAAIDGMAGVLHVFDARRGKRLYGKPVALHPGGRWHLAGTNPETGHIYLVTETSERKVIQAGKIALDRKSADVIVALPEFTEGVGMTYHPGRDQVYVPYDNHATVHVVDFAAGGTLGSIAVPAYGNDAAAIDVAGDRLYLGSWAHGEVEIVDLAQQRFVGRVQDQGIIPHMFAMTFNAANGQLYFPVGASAVNGCFGASVTRLDPATGESAVIRTGWAPIALVEVPGRDAMMVFDNEGGYAEVRADGHVVFHDLPHRYPLRAIQGPDEQIYLAYGPHQSYWPTVYIWAARNGVMSIDPETLELYDRRIPRQPLDLALDGRGTLYLPQNNWGGEEQFVNQLGGSVRELDIRQRLELPDEVVRETTQRILDHDPGTDRLYLVRVGEADDDPSVLQVIDPESGEVEQRLELGINATDLLFDEHQLYVANFDSGTVSVIAKDGWEVRETEAGDGPLALCQVAGEVFVIDHRRGEFRAVGAAKGRDWTSERDFPGAPQDAFAWRDGLVITGYSHDELVISYVEHPTASAHVVSTHRVAYPYGEARFDTPNSAFYLSGQFGDAVFTLTPGEVDRHGNLWLADFLSGKVFILSPSE